MKTIIKHILHGLVAFAFVCSIISCEKDINNDIPKADKNLKAVQQDFKNTLLKNTIDENGKIWVSKNSLTLANTFNWLLLRSIAAYTPTFLIGFDFKADGNAKMYLTVAYPEQNRSEEPLGDIPDNPNTYRTAGVLRTDLTFLNKSVFSYLKSREIIGFDYYITSFKDTEIKMKTYYTRGRNIDITLQPYDFDKFKTFAKATEIFYRNNSLNADPFAAWFRGRTIIREKETGRSIENRQNNNAFAFARLTSLFQQVYDENRNLYLFRLQDFTDEEISTIDTRYPGLAIDKYYSLGIKYLHPIEVTDTRIVFDTYGNNTQNDQRYQVIYERLN